MLAAGSLENIPDLIAFRLVFTLPRIVWGPVDLRLLARFAATNALLTFFRIRATAYPLPFGSAVGWQTTWLSPFIRIH
jgi:hypothetical protein